MKRNICILLALLFTATSVFAQDEYYFGNLGKLNPAIPTPESFFGFRIGASLVRYDKVVEYFKLLADKSERASLQVFGKSWEDREQVKLFVTSPENLRNLENIRQEHLKLIDPEASADFNAQKVIVELAYNVHGGEIAGTDASVLAAYYLVASEDADIVRRLNEAVVLIEPSQNPDGRERATNYINSFTSFPPVADPADRGHGNGITPHRGNHFWNDLNRDWLPLSQIESRNRVAFYHKWYPNVYLDYHEMGSASTFYFEPSPPSTWNNILPRDNYEKLNGILAKHFSAALNSIGSLFYTKESFTNLSPIYGSTYPDYQGGVGTTLEIGSTSGVVIETAAGLRTFSRNLRDNFLTSIAAVRAATDEKETFLKYQKDFFKSALSQADKLPAKHIVFGSVEDRSLNSLFVNHLLQHQIEVYELASSFSQDGKRFEPGSAYVVPLRQRQFRVLQSIFEENETNGFDDKTTFYDISAWSTVHGYGIPFVKVKTPVKEGAKVSVQPEIRGAVEGRSELAYVFDWFDYLAPKALYYLQDKGVKARVSQLPFTSKTVSGNRDFARGAIVIPAAYQDLPSDELFKLLNEAAQLANIRIYAVSDGFSLAGIDLGSNNIRVLKKPAVAVIASGNWTGIGELWALFGNTHNIPLVKIDPETAARVDLSKYTSIILNGGQLSPALNSRITAWLENGGTLIALSGAAQWASTLIAPAGGRRDSVAVTTPTPDVSSRFGGSPGSRLYGIVVRSELNLSHHLTYGFKSADFYTLKNSVSGLNITSPDNVVLKIAKGELVNGYATAESLSKLQDKVVIATGNRGAGSVLIFGESPTFRGYWLAPGRILINATLFGAGTNRGRLY
jgi:hypothetical protein